MVPARPWLIPACILALALALRLAGAAWWQSRLPAGEKFYFGDSASYWDLAGDIAAGREYEYQQSKIFRTPGYPLVLAPLFVWWHGEPPIFAARAWNALWGTAAVGGLMILARMMFDQRVANVAGLFAAMLPEAIAGSVFVLSEAAFVPLMFVQLILARRAATEKDLAPTIVFALCGGVFGGIATLVRPSWLLFTPLLAVIDAVIARKETNWPRRSSLLALPLAGLVVAMVPWWIRNYHVSGEFVPTSTEVGSSLYDGLNPSADGSSNMDFKKPLEAKFARTREAFIPPSNLHPAAREVRLDRFYRQEALGWAKEHPGRVLQLAGIKFLRLWNLWPNAADFRSVVGRLAIALTYGPLIILAIVGMIKTARTKLSLLAPALYLTLLHTIFVSSLRYRLPALLPLLIFSAVAALWLYDGYLSSSNSSSSSNSNTA